GLGRFAQRLNHGVDVVLELGDLALGLDADGAGQVARGDRAGHLGDRPDLAGEVPGQLVDVLSQPLPGAGHVLHFGLATEQPLAAHLPRDAGDLGRERRELVDHRVDGVLQLEDLALDIHGDLLTEVTPGHRRRDLRNVPDLTGEVAGHGVHRVGQVLPRARDTRYLSLAAELPIGAHLPGHPGYLRGEQG